MQTLRIHGTIPKGHPFPIISWLDRLIEGSDMSHNVVEITKSNRVFHAHFEGGIFQPVKKWKEGVEIKHTVEFTISDEQMERTLKVANKYLAPRKGYFRKLFGALVPTLIRRFFFIHIPNLFSKGMEDGQGILCSEMLRKLALDAWDWNVPRKPYPENYWTKDILKLAMNNGAVKIM